MNANQPLGLPKGSVRAILALFVVIVPVLLGAVLALTAKVDPEKVFLSLVGLSMLALNAYFLTRSQGTGA